MQQWYKCPECGKDILYGTNPCPYCKCSLAWSQQGPILYLPPAAQPEPAYQPQQPQQTPQYQEQYKAEPPKKKTNVWLMGCLGLIVLAAIIGGIAVATSSGTPASAPTSSEKTTITAAEKAYALTVADQATTMSNALTEIGDLLQNYQFGNSQWTINVATQLAKIRMVHDEAMAMTPPSSMTEIHYKYTQGLKHYYTMTDLLAQGIDELDTSLIEQAVTEGTIANDYITEATNLINDFTKSKLK